MEDLTKLIQTKTEPLRSKQVFREHFYTLKALFLHYSVYLTFLYILSTLWTICGRGNKPFDIHLWRISPVHFLSKDGIGASYEGKDGWKSCLFPAGVGILTLI